MKESYPTYTGQPAPLGTSKIVEGINFAVHSNHAQSMVLSIYAPWTKSPFFEVTLDPQKNKTGSIWHICIDQLPDQFDYTYEVNGKLDVTLIDPYATAVRSHMKWGIEAEGEHPHTQVYIDHHHFDWQDIKPPRLPLEDLIIYEMHVRSFTVHPSSHTAHPGTYLGIIEKIPYLKKLGINAVELMPIYEFDECEYKRTNPLTGQRLLNVWGYMPINFFSPMSRYATTSDIVRVHDELKTLIRELHRNQIEVILDVVYNHTGDVLRSGKVYSFGGLDPATYYCQDEHGKMLDYTGVGNTFSCNNPIAMELVLASLRWWIQEFQVDGFRFDLASAMTRDPRGHPMDHPPIFQMINKDPLISSVRLIAESWDAAGLYQLGCFPRKGLWSEWNGRFRDVVRRFIKGTDGHAGHFATALCGSEDLYAKHGRPHSSINFITAHDGFTLRDLVTYQQKYNLENGEDNRDGLSDNDSYNCGFEGETHLPDVMHLRNRQRRNFCLALMVSLGVPMILMGDEQGHTRNGNNNAWCQDNERNWFLWDQPDEDFFRFFQLAIRLRKLKPTFRQKTFLTNEQVEWHGHHPMQADWSETSRFVAYTLKNEGLFIAFNAHYHEATVVLPSPPPGKHWYLVADTSRPSPQDFIENPHEGKPILNTYHMLSYSSLILEAF